MNSFSTHTVKSVLLCVISESFINYEYLYTTIFLKFQKSKFVSLVKNYCRQVFLPTTFERSSEISFVDFDIGFGHTFVHQNVDI